MRRFFMSLLILSLFATVGTLYWRTYLPETPVPASGGATRGGPDSPAPQSPAPAQDGRPGGGVSFAPSDRQDMAVTISIVSSIVSAIAAVLQTLLTARAIRR
jgi:hypothetical protein